MTIFKKLVGLTAFVGLVFCAQTRAADDIKIGVIFPLSGNSAGAGKSALAAIELAAQIINEPHPELAPLTRVAGGLADAILY